MGEDAPPGTVGTSSDDEDEQPFMNLQNEGTNGNEISVKDGNLLSPRDSENNGFEM